MSRARRKPVEVDPTSVPGIYYVVERYTARGWESVTGSFRTALEAQWARADLHVRNKALAISATRARRGLMATDSRMVPASRRTTVQRSDSSTAKACLAKLRDELAKFREVRT
jgi:hypothetical protein